jgi:hypothetical protein
MWWTKLTNRMDGAREGTEMTEAAAWGQGEILTRNRKSREVLIWKGTW